MNTEQDMIITMNETLRLRNVTEPEEGLVDLEEWCSLEGLPLPFDMPTAITHSLWRVIERIPFRMISRVRIADRVLHVVDRARLRLGSPDAVHHLKHLERHFFGLFSAALPTCAEDRARRPLMLRWEPATSRSAGRLLIGLAEELDAPAARARETPRSEPAPSGYFW